MIKKILLSIAVISAAVGMSIEMAEAKRLGGGRNTGIQRQVTPMNRQATPPAASPQQATPNTARPAQPAAAPAAQQSGWRKWAGPLAGLAAGIGLAALLSHLGVGGEFAGILLAVLAAVVIFALLRRFMGGAARSSQPEPAYAGNVSPMSRESWQAPAENAGSGAPATVGNAFPAGFDVEAFERQAKLNFIRLQAANDAADLPDLRDFTTPEVFAEIKLGIDERGGKPQKTDVVVLNAEVLEVVEDAGRYIASVRYHGALREEADAAPSPFDEVWHLVKPVDGSRGWTLAGIQQLA